ncbi:MAG TPA: SHOCT domain-containing protein [Actinomycetota bacterium]|nr:SHOCT domain-containing protein [Actinomycetota bacterium]
MPFNWGWDTGWEWGWIFGLAAMLFWIAVIVGAVLLLRRDAPRLRDRFTTPSALRILEERYASGEITRDEFLERRAVLLREPGAVRSTQQSTPAMDTGTEKLSIGERPPESPPPNTPPPEPPLGSTRE